ncbi:hypothetical protein [Allomuricauda sp. SCSIO 65647]|uniref:hypothetical protein n=1 Tax=Allomuricauda sp. SCSIO 65647 TaxID=2908843 RepID=UPI001F39FD43|nr:hypothetical protein [Muricauda sp. SCSIO 65647]UJH66381.1 hypothetical protein L0P89_10420 [Muricauda sp. SCSIO 65647]
MVPVFEPFVGIGDFELDTTIDKYLGDYNFKILNKDGKYDCDKYIIDNPDMSLYVDENNIIESISCREECLYKGRNIIGMNIDEFINYYDIAPVGDVDIMPIGEEMQDVYEFDDIGLQVWCVNDKIVTIIASTNDEG